MIIAVAGALMAYIMTGTAVTAETVAVAVVGRLSLPSSRGAHLPGVYPSFYSMKRLRALLVPLHRRRRGHGFQIPYRPEIFFRPYFPLLLK